MTTPLLKELTTIKEQLEAAKTEKMKAEATKEELERQLADLNNQVRALGFDPDKLAEEMENLKVRISTMYTELKELVGGK